MPGAIDIGGGGKKKVFLNSYLELPVSVGKELSSLDGIDFELDGGTGKGYLSHLIKPFSKGAAPTILFRSVNKPGTFSISAKSKGIVHGKVDIEVTREWADQKKGPATWNASTHRPPRHAQYAQTGPKMVTRSQEKGGRLKAAVVLVEPYGLSFQNSLIGGVEWSAEKERDFWVANFNSGTDYPLKTLLPRSVRRYFAEISSAHRSDSTDRSEEGAKILIEATVFGPIKFTAPENDLFKYFSRSNNFAKRDRKTSRYPFFDDCFDKIDSDINHAVPGPDTLTLRYGDYDLFVFVVKTDQRGCPWFSTYYNIGTVSPADQPPFICQPIVLMDSQMINIDWHGQDAPNNKAPVYREALEIASHEIGHALGLDDVDEGNLCDGRYELMRGDSYLPSLSLFNRMKLGLLEEGWIKRIALPVNETFYLDPLRGLRPNDPRASTGLVLDLLDSFKVLIEYRAMPEPDKQISDLEQKSGAVLAYLYDESDRCGSASTPLRLLSTDGGKWCVLEKEGDSFTVALKAADQSVLGRPTELTIECVPWVEGEVKPSPSTVKVRVEAGPGGPNPYMTKCPGGMTWQSPDIEIRNERNAQDPQYKNLPWADHDNEIVATVHNSGSEDAPQVWVDFFCKEYTLQVDGGGAGEIKIGEAVQDVPARGHAEFHCPWHPEKAGNESVIVRIRSYVSPVSGVPELSSSDNCACSNYAEFISASGSPFGLARSSVRVANHKDEAADFFLQQYQDNESFVTFLGSSRLSMEPGERTSVDLMFKRDKGPTKDGPLGREEGINNVALVAWKEVDEAKGPRRPEIIGGVQARVFSGKATRFYTLRVDQIRRWIKFAVVDSNGKAVTGGKVILTFRDLPGDNKKEKYLTCTLDSQGMGSADLPCPRGRVQGYYLAGPGYTECYSQWIELREK